jgi:hypothetical protein
MDDENPYYSFFKETIGRGSGKYYTGIGHVYTTRRGLQRGSGFFMPGAPMFNKRGMGFGNVMRALFRMATPILKVLGSKAVDVASNIAKDTIQGENIKDSAVRHVSNEGKQLLGRVPSSIRNILDKSGEISADGISPTSAEVEIRPAEEQNKNKKVAVKRAAFKVKNKTFKRGRGISYPALKYMQ